jgi:ElaB/YqjD/DUF883 family membrane-anchored ribosome-binding protein
VSDHVQVPAPDKDALEHEIEETRDALVDTVDAIVDRVHPAKVKDRTTEQLKRDVDRTTEQAREKVDEVRAKAEEVRDQAKAYVEQDPDRAKKLAAGVAAVLVLAWLFGRRRERSGGGEA